MPQAKEMIIVAQAYLQASLAGSTEDQLKLTHQPSQPHLNHKEKLSMQGTKELTE
jgi:hypothetical protein